DEERLARAGPPAVSRILVRDEPERDRDLRRIEEPIGKRDDALDEIGLDDRPADLALAALARAERSVCEDEARRARRREMGDDVLYPGEVRVAPGREAEREAAIAAELPSAPVPSVERRVGEDDIRDEPLVQVAAKRVGVPRPEVRLDPADGHVH